MATPLVSIITPAYKAESFIVEAVRSVLAQTYRQWEMLIVSDDGQDYRTVLAQNGITDGRLKFLSTEGTRTGPSRGRNVGMREAAGEVIAFLDADDVWSENYLTATVPEVLAHGMVKTKLLHRYWHGDHYSDGTMAHEPPAGKNSATALFDYHGQINLLARRDLTAFNWREDIQFAEDVVFSLQLSDAASGFYYQPAARYYYSLRGGSASSGQHQPVSMITLKQYIRSIVARNDISLHDSHLKQAFLDYYDRSVLLESLYHEAQARGEKLSFSDFAMANEHKIMNTSKVQHA